MNPIRCFSTILLFFSFSILLAQDPPANNTCQTATALTIYDGGCNSPTVGTLVGATNTGGLTDCDGYGYTPVDVWYSTVVPDSAELAIYTFPVDESPLPQTFLQFYRIDEDGEFTRFHCQATLDATLRDLENTIDDFSGEVFTDLTPNEIIYTRVVNGKEAYYGGARVDERGPFNICVFDPSTLETPLIKSPLLSYYSNPVGNRLSVESPYDIQSLSVYDLAVREVMRKNPQQQKLTLDTYSLSSGVYLLEVQTAAGAQTVKLVKK